MEGRQAAACDEDQQLRACSHQSIYATTQWRKIRNRVDLIDYADDYVIVKGGHYIPVSAILDVGV